ncbi:lipoprotein [Sphingomonas xinjiangensis]|uniref:Putative small lipoprotein YifL n=1 Tax=Sphingomonas xinjiangensis TaxID=643568 RepID=A0A840YN43_9SPHN|nr:lipoprotein [Sphingomonas xinjiangensis]MBB5711240.1 putative small lipoprotein YifL [Sphingomonas xinjiangensis]
MKQLLLVAMSAALAGCGARGDLKPAEGQALPPPPYGATATPTPADLLQPAPLTRPARSDELIQSSERRRSDEFDLPPPN